MLVAGLRFATAGNHSRILLRIWGDVLAIGIPLTESTTTAITNPGIAVGLRLAFKVATRGAVGTINAKTHSMKKDRGGTRSALPSSGKQIDFANLSVTNGTLFQSGLVGGWITENSWMTTDTVKDRVWPPSAGYFTYRKLLERLPNGRWRKGPIEPCRIWFGPPLDPITGDEMDRSWRWNCVISGLSREIDDAWPNVASDKISEEEYTRLLKREPSEIEKDQLIAGDWKRKATIF